MRRLPVTFVLLLISLSAFAQDVQISFDEEGHIYVIDRSLAASIGVFGDRDGFQEARLFRQSDGSFHIEISYLSDGQLLRERETLTESQVADLRARVESYLDDRRSVYIDQEGRPYFLRRTAAMSYLVYGPSLVGVLDIDDPGAATAVALLTGSAGFFVPFLMTRDRPVPMPAARMAFGGSVLGYAHGLAAAMAVGGDDLSGQAAFTSALVFSVGEATVGYR
ncbi:MAG: hypothetical protein ACOCTG_07085, partial [Bacteroidota bacterium]